MKKLLLITLLLIGCGLAFTGCSKKSDDGSDPSGSISKTQLVGKWLYVKIVNNGDTDTFNNGEYLQFNADGTAYDSEGSGAVRWTLSGSKITVIDEDRTDIANIDKLTSSELVLSVTDEEGHRTAYFKK